MEYIRMLKVFVRSSTVVLLLFVLNVVAVFAQAVDCLAAFQTALDAAAENCADLGRNQACLAYGSASLTSAEGAADDAFTQPGDRVDAAAIAQLAQTGADGWALTLLRLQLNQPDEAEEHNTVLLLMGDLELTAAEWPEVRPSPTSEYIEESTQSAPLSAFNVDNSNAGPCAGQLPTGVLIQSPNLKPADEGYQITRLFINGWDFALGSTVLVNTFEGGETVAEVLEHYASIGGQDGDVLVLAGQNIELPPGTPFVGSEDGSIVVVPTNQTESPTTADDHGIINDLLQDLLGTEEVANRQPEPPPDNAETMQGNVATGFTNSINIFTDGFWVYDVGMSSFMGDCLMANPDMFPSSSEIITLDERVVTSPDGSLYGFNYVSMGMDTVLPFEEWDANQYVAEDRMGIVTTLIDLEVVTRFMMQGTITGIIGDGVQLCVIETPILLESCVVDAFYGATNGNGVCPADIHDAMGTR